MAANVLAHYYLTLSVPVNYQQPTSPYITHNITFGDEKMRIDQTKPTTED